jgi:hypothetical protein
MFDAKTDEIIAWLARQKLKSKMEPMTFEMFGKSPNEIILLKEEKVFWRGMIDKLTDEQVIQLIEE